MLGAPCSPHLFMITCPILPRICYDLTYRALMKYKVVYTFEVTGIKDAMQCTKTGQILVVLGVGGSVISINGN